MTMSKYRFECSNEAKRAEDFVEIIKQYLIAEGVPI